MISYLFVFDWAVCSIYSEICLSGVDESQVVDGNMIQRLLAYLRTCFFEDSFCKLTACIFFRKCMFNKLTERALNPKRKLCFLVYFFHTVTLSERWKIAIRKLTNSLGMPTLPKHELL